MIFRKFKESDTSVCMNIWDLSFPGDLSFSKMFFSEVIGLTDAYVCEYKSDVAGFISVFEFIADSDSGQLDCYYIYGVCVHPDFRKLGIMRKMLTSVMELYKGQFILIPQVVGLYEKFGFRYTNTSESILFDNPIHDFKECYNIEHLNKIYNIYRKKFRFSLRRTSDWWKVIIKTSISDGYKIIANDGAYAIIKDKKILEFAYVSDEYKNSLPVGRAVLKLPEVMTAGIEDCTDNYIALMLEWE